MLHVHRSERADGLVDALGLLLADEPLPDAFAPEVVSVPTRGMERWLTQRLSTSLGASPGRRDGVCANIDFPFPRRLAADAVAAASGIDPADDPWLPDRALWPLLEVIDASLPRALAPNTRRLPRRPGRRPDRRGARSRPEGPPPAERRTPDRSLRPLRLPPARDAPGLARRRGHRRRRPPASPGRRLAGRALAIASAGGSPGPSPAERVDAACARIRADPSVVELPHRLSLFGLTRLPAGLLGVLRALAADRDVHLFLLHPSPALWAAVSPRAGPPPSAAVAGRRPDRRAPRPTACSPPGARTPARCSSSSRRRAATRPRRPARRHRPAVDHHHPVDQPTAACWPLIQADVRADRRPPGAPLPGQDDRRPLLDADDRSLQIHSCHGRARQVEVVRDAILHELAEDPALEPRDVIVMCPDIETFAPLIAATFGAGEVSPTTARTRSRPTAARPISVSAWPTGHCSRPTRSSASSAS